MNGEWDDGYSDQPALSLKSQIESLLFVANEPVHVGRLASVLQADAGQIDQALGDLAQEYADRGLRLQRKGQQVQMVTAPEAADSVRLFLGLEAGSKLSPAALETLAIIAYRQPVTRAQIEAVRGVNSDSVLRTLINLNLIEEQGRLDQVGRPIIYGTTFEFLQQFGLASLDQLPPLRGAEPSL
jgi:segregation and condensation protein B